jgi:molybdopterin biosynthesis enzyme
VETVAHGDAVGRVLATPPVAKSDVPSDPRAARRGHPVDAAATRSASRDAPAVFDDAPAVEPGDPIPTDADAVAPPPVVERHDGRIEVGASLVPGEGVVDAGATATANAAVLHERAVVRRSDAAVLERAGVARCEVHVRPRVAVTGEAGPVEAAVTAALRRQGCEPVDGGDVELSVVVGGRPDDDVIFEGLAANPGGWTAATAGPSPTLHLASDAATRLVVEPLLAPVARRLARRPSRRCRGEVRLTAKTPSTVGETTFVGVRLEDRSRPRSRGDGADAGRQAVEDDGVPAATPVAPRASHDAVIRIPERVEGRPEDAIVTARYTEV